MIISSAIMIYSKTDVYKTDFRYPMIICGKRHADIFEKIFDLRIDYDLNSSVQGFFTSEGKFLDRYKAAEYAYNCDQIPERTNMLFSEDLWREDEE